ncbi:hypothetical protein MMPV_006439 [Pyropia vietnamensis]
MENEVSSLGQGKRPAPGQAESTTKGAAGGDVHEAKRSKVNHEAQRRVALEPLVEVPNAPAALRLRTTSSPITPSVGAHGGMAAAASADGTSSTGNTDGAGPNRVVSPAAAAAAPVDQVVVFRDRLTAGVEAGIASVASAAEGATVTPARPPTVPCTGRPPVGRSPISATAVPVKACVRSARSPSLPPAATAGANNTLASPSSPAVLALGSPVVGDTDERHAAGVGASATNPRTAGTAAADDAPHAPGVVRAYPARHAAGAAAEPHAPRLTAPRAAIGVASSQPPAGASSAPRIPPHEAEPQAGAPPASEAEPRAGAPPASEAEPRAGAPPASEAEPQAGAPPASEAEPRAGAPPASEAEPRAGAPPASEAEPRAGAPPASVATAQTGATPAQAGEPRAGCSQAAVAPRQHSPNGIPADAADVGSDLDAVGESPLLAAEGDAVGVPRLTGGAWVVTLGLSPAEADANQAMLEVQRQTAAAGPATTGPWLALPNDLARRTRIITVDWVMEVCAVFHIGRLGMYTAVSLIDRVLAATQVDLLMIQLVAVTSVFVASKLHDTEPIEIGQAVAISADAYTEEQVLEMERYILRVTEWKVIVPTAFTFFPHLVRAGLLGAGVSPTGSDLRLDVQYVAYLLSELSLLENGLSLAPPAVVSAAVVSLALGARGLPTWSEDLAAAAGVDVPTMEPVYKRLFHMWRLTYTARNPETAPERIPDFLYVKYNNEELHTPPDNVPDLV